MQRQFIIHNSKFRIDNSGLIRDNLNTNCSFGKYKIAARYVQGTSKVHPRYVKVYAEYMQGIGKVEGSKPIARG